MKELEKNNDFFWLGVLVGLGLFVILSIAICTDRYDARRIESCNECIKIGRSVNECLLITKL